MKKKHFYAAVILLLFLAIGIQPAFAVRYIPSDTTIGDWDVDDRIYTLTTNVSEGLEIVQSNLTFNGNDKVVSGSGQAGILLEGRTGITAKNVTVSGFVEGISLRFSNGCTVTGNTVSTCGYGIWLAGSCNNTVTGNTVNSSSEAGIWIQSDSDENTLSGNTVTGVSITGGIGIYIQLCIDNTLSSNTVSNYKDGIKLSHSYSNIDRGNTLTTNNISNNYWGIHLYSSNYNTLTGNNVSDNAGGIWLENSSFNSLEKNKVTGKGNIGTGIYLDPSNNNTVKDNYISLHVKGIKILYSSGNQIYNNNFINNTNTPQAEVVGGTGNLFNLGDPTEGGEGGNYWSDWSGSGPYVIVLDVVQDEFPWAVQDGWLDTIPPIISCPGNTVIVGPDGVPVDDERIQTFLNGASATDNCDPEPTITNNAPDVFPPGDTVVTFTATDAAGNSSSCSSTVTVVDTEGNLRIIPSIINREGRLEKILAVIRFPEGTTEEDIDIGQPLILYPGDSLNGIEATSQRIVTWYMWGTLRVSVFASFSKDEVTADVPDGLAEMMVIGRFDDSADGEYFYGFDNVWIISWDW